jgi:hypothetical protein
MTPAQRAAFFKGHEVMRSNDAAMMPNTHEHTISKMRMTSE